MKTATSRPAHPGQNVSYELVVRNDGPSSATNVRVTDALPAELSFVSGSAGCAASGQTVGCTLPSLAAGASHTFTVTARVANAATGTVSNTGTVTSDTPDSDPSNNSDPEEVPSGPKADLSITKTSPGPVLTPPIWRS